MSESDSKRVQTKTEKQETNKSLNILYFSDSGFTI